MNKVVKWILIGLLGLVLIACVAGVTFMVLGRWSGAGWMMPGQAWEGRMMPFGRVPFDRMPMHAWGGRGIGLFGFFPLGRLLGGLVIFGLFALVVAGLVALFLRPRHSLPAAAVAAPAVIAAAPVVEPAATPAEPAAEHLCPSCARPAQPEWQHCPYCGSPLT
jgi:hypothetical protein